MPRSMREQATTVAKQVKLLLCVLCASCSTGPGAPGSTEELAGLPQDTRALRGTFLPEKSIPELQRFPDLVTLYFGGWGEPTLTDIGLERLGTLDLPKLQSLFLGPNPYITDSGLRHLSGLRSIRNLGLASCHPLTDDGLRVVATLTQLEGLDLRGNPRFTDAGVHRLETMGNLRVLLLDGCKNVTREAAARLQSALPECRVTKDDVLWAEQMKSRPENRSPFTRHTNPGVRYPARLGFGVGMVVGVPVAILALPFVTGSDDSNLGPIVPMYFCAFCFGTVFGGIVWPLFGWWPPISPDEGIREGNYLKDTG